MSNNFRPKPKAAKRGKLKKPQSQKEPKLSYPREFQGIQNNIYGGSHIIDNPNYYHNHGLIPDQQMELPLFIVILIELQQVVGTLLITIMK